MRPHTEAALGVGRGATGREMPARALALPADHVVKAGFHDVIGCFSTKVFTHCRAGPSDRTRLGEQGALESREVAQAHKLRAFGNGLGNFFVLNAGQDARQAVAAA